MREPRVNSDLWKAKGFLHKGWVLVDVEDVGDDDGEESYESCDWCGTSIRYVHHLFHPETEQKSKSGCICAEYLTGDYSGAGRLKEEKLRKFSSMARYWATSPRWHISEKGNYYRRDKQLQILVFQHQGGWKIKVGESWGDKVFEDLGKAQIESLRLYVDKTTTLDKPKRRSRRKKENQDEIYLSFADGNHIDAGG